MQQKGAWRLAYQYCIKATQLDPTNKDATELLFEIANLIGRTTYIKPLIEESLQDDPNDIDLMFALATTLHREGNEKATKEYLDKILSIDPQYQRASHTLNSVLGKTTASAPAQYVESLFNDYSSRFETHLLSYLDYQAHLNLAKIISKKHSKKDSFSTAIDLGCGTGLMGEALKKYFQFNTFIGVDLSGKMLEIAKKKNIYDSVERSDMATFLKKCSTKFDLISACDSFVYIGNLDSIFAHSFESLNSGGFFCFAAEAFNGHDFKLSKKVSFKSRGIVIKKRFNILSWSGSCSLS